MIGPRDDLHPQAGLVSAQVLTPGGGGLDRGHRLVLGSQQHQDRPIVEAAHPGTTVEGELGARVGQHRVVPPRQLLQAR